KKEYCRPCRRRRVSRPRTVNNTSVGQNSRGRQIDVKPPILPLKNWALKFGFAQKMDIFRHFSQYMTIRLAMPACFQIKEQV
ncbi:MAG: hypothetical protein AAF067_11410, partial [Pseudomonadota bacterium]